MSKVLEYKSPDEGAKCAENTSVSVGSFTPHKYVPCCKKADYLVFHHGLSASVPMCGPHAINSVIRLNASYEMENGLICKRA